MDAAPVHLLLLPFPSQGHITPMLHLSVLLSSRGSFVTFVVTQRCHKRLLESRSCSVDLPNIRFVSIPDGVPPDCNLDMSVHEFIRVSDGLEKQQPLVKELIMNSRSNSALTPISCIIADYFFPWMQELANQLGIAGVIFWTGNSTSLYAFNLPATKGTDASKSSSPENQDILSTIVNTSPDFKAWAVQLLKGNSNATWILVNTFRDLEASLFLPALELKLPIKCVGPVFSFETDDPSNRLEPTLVSSTASLLEEEIGCLKWLDTQGECSVLYVSSGSRYFFSHAQIEQLALGIEASGQPFLWVAPPEKTTFPAGFKDRTKDQGLIIGWAPQLQVLEHPSISCFLTHCGWNSTLEGIWAGVPLLCLPIYGDQKLNAKLVVKVLQVGLGWEKMSQDGIVGWEEVKKVTMEMMQMEEGRKVRDRSRYWKAMARNAGREGGPSCADLRDFMEDIIARSLYEAKLES